MNIANSHDSGSGPDSLDGPPQADVRATRAPGRALRRVQARQIGRRRRAVWLHLLHGPVLDESHDCGCGPTYFSKRRPVFCQCSRRQSGAPRFARGRCKYGDRNRIYRWRRQVRELGCLGRRHGGRWDDWDDDSLITLVSPETVSPPGTRWC